MVNRDSILTQLAAAYAELQTLERHPFWAERSAEGGLDPERSPLVALSRAQSALAEAVDTLRDERDRTPASEPAASPTAAGESDVEGEASEGEAIRPRGAYVPDSSIRSGQAREAKPRGGRSRGDR